MSSPGTPDGPFPARLPPETPTERIRELLVELEGTSDGRIASVLASIAAVSPTSTGLTLLVDAVAPWLGEFGQQRYRERLEHILWWLVDAIDRMAIEPEARPDVADWGELVLTVLPMALRARAEKKREAFGALLANGLRHEAPADRDEGRTMAIILDQLEYEHIEALANVSDLPRSLSLDMFWGYRSETSLDRLKYPPNELYGARLLRLQALGLITIFDASTQDPKSTNKMVRINDLGRRFHDWIRIDGARDKRS